MKQLVDSISGAVFPLKQYPRPKRVVAVFNVIVSGKKVEAVSTRGEKYTYLNLDGIDFYVDGRLQDGQRFRVVEVEDAKKAA